MQINGPRYDARPASAREAVFCVQQIGKTSKVTPSPALMTTCHPEHDGETAQLRERLQIWHLPINAKTLDA